MSTVAFVLLEYPSQGPPDRKQAGKAIFLEVTALLSDLLQQ
jgi:hypothetical protein